MPEGLPNPPDQRLRGPGTNSIQDHTAGTRTGSGGPTPTKVVLLSTPAKLAVSINDAAAMLSVNPRTIRRHIADGTIPAFRLPGGRDLRVPVAAIEAIVNGGNAGGARP